jgi:cysteine desulfurase/selenocysteine lyase
VIKSLESYRDEFPVTRNYVYLDHAGVAPVSLRVKRAVEEFIADATESGAFNYASWTKRVEEIRRKSAALIGAEPEEIAFVRNTSHGISIVSQGLDWKKGII